MTEIEDLVRNFGMANLLAEVALDEVEKKHSLSLHRPFKKIEDKDEKYYPQFEQKIREEAAQMARYYEIFYCLERSIRSQISQRMQEVYKESWWENKVPQQVKDEAEKRRKQEIGKGVTPRSTDLMDYTNFGELGTIITANWETFADTFSDKKAVESVMTMLNTLRGPIAHRTLLAEDEVVRLHMTLRDWFRLME